jgi:MspA
MVFRRIAAVVLCLAAPLVLAPPVVADPEPAPPPPAEGAPPPAADAAPPPDDGRVPSSPPQSVKTPDGWTLTVSAKDETLLPVPPLTTALSSRDYVTGGIFSGSLVGPEGEARGVLEVGYQIGCGIDMSTSQGVTLTGSIGFSPRLGLLPEGFFPDLVAPVAGAISVGLKPGIVHIVAVDKKEFEGSKPWIMISNFHVKIDGCVGQSFIRSYATLTRQTTESDAVLSWVGVTKAV